MKLSFTITSKNECLPFIKEISHSIMRLYGLNYDDTKKMQLAIEEASINSVRHAYGPGEDGVIEMTFNLEDNKFSVVIKDYGKGIDPDRLKVYDVNDVDSIASVSGRGFFLMQAMMDEFEINSTPGMGTRIHISKHVRRK